jgi:hypothetical protein
LEVRIKLFALMLDTLAFAFVLGILESDPHELRIDPRRDSLVNA